MIEQHPIYRYAVGEEVVVRLEELLIYEIGLSTVTVSPLPPWTIAEITGLGPNTATPRYRIEFAFREGRHACDVDESAIDGTA